VVLSDAFDPVMFTAVNLDANTGALRFWKPFNIEDVIGESWWVVITVWDDFKGFSPPMSAVLNITAIPIGKLIVILCCYVMVLVLHTIPCSLR
jgi:hypothetical protein